MATFRGTPSHTHATQFQFTLSFMCVCRRESLFKLLLLHFFKQAKPSKYLIEIWHGFGIIIQFPTNLKHAPGCSIFGHSWAQKPSKSLSSTPPRCQVQDRNPLNLACWQKPHQIKNPAEKKGGFTSCFLILCVCVPQAPFV